VNRLRTLFGEPVAVWAAIQAVLVAIESFGWLDWAGIHGQPDMARLVAVISTLAAIHIAIVTHHTLLAPLVQLMQAFASFLVIYGLHISAEQTALLVGVLTAVAAAWHRTQTGPEPVIT
jgi:hypothetical protein